jgi:hypothetical protein
VNPDASLSLFDVAESGLVWTHDAACHAESFGIFFPLGPVKFSVETENNSGNSRCCHGHTAGKAEPAENIVRS